MTEKLIVGRSDATKGITQTKALPSGLGRRAEILRVLKQASLYDIIWYVAIIAISIVGIVLAYSEWLAYLTAAEMFCGLVAANLIARGKIIGIWLNILDCTMFGVIAFITHTYGELFKVFVISNVFNIYGIINWSKASNKEVSVNEFDVRVLSKKMNFVLYSLFVLGSVGVYFVLNAIGTSKAYIGCITFTANIIVKYLQMSRYKEAWYFSLLSDGLSFVMWVLILSDNVATSGDWSILPTAAGSLGYFVNSVNGLIVWNKLFKRRSLSGSVYLAMRPMKRISKFVKLKRNYAHLFWRDETDHIPTKDEIAIARKMRVSFRRGMFTGS